MKQLLIFKHDKGDYNVYLNCRLLRWINGGFWAKVKMMVK
jgi:hypothetical protein